MEAATGLGPETEAGAAAGMEADLEALPRSKNKSGYHHFPSKCTACPRLPPPGGLARTPPVGVPPLTCGRVPPPRWVRTPRRMSECSAHTSARDGVGTMAQARVTVPQSRGVVCNLRTLER